MFSIFIGDTKVIIIFFIGDFYSNYWVVKNLRLSREECLKTSTFTKEQIFDGNVRKKGIYYNATQ